MTPEEASLRGRLGAAVQRSRHDPHVYTQPARDAAWQRFLDQVDPGLPPTERHERAKAAQRAHMLRIALASARARKKARR